MSIDRHSEEHSYDIDAAEALTLVEWVPSAMPDCPMPRTYLVEHIHVKIADGKIWHLFTMGPVIEPQYGLSNIRVREHWDWPELGERGAPLTAWLNTHVAPVAAAVLGSGEQQR